MAQWHGLRELGSARGLTFLYWIHCRLGRVPFRLALYPVVLWYLLLKPVPRRASKQFLSLALGRPAGLKDQLRHFVSFSESMLDKLVAWNNGVRFEDVTIRGHKPAADALAAGRGFILIASHMGNVEICRVLSRWRPGLELHVLVHTRHAENFNRVMRQLDPSSHLNLHQVTAFDAGLAAWMAERVAAGAVLVIAGDRVPVSSGKVVQAPFLGHPAPFAQGPWVLAHALGCPVLLFFCLLGEKGYEIDFEAFEQQVVLPRGAARDEAIGGLARRYAQRLEHYARRDPYQWFNFFPFWETPA
jgi:predicted LPLAT superfamily acyltransferase